MTHVITWYSSIWWPTENITIVSVCYWKQVMCRVTYTCFISIHHSLPTLHLTLITFSSFPFPLSLIYSTHIMNNIHGYREWNPKHVTTNIPCDGVSVTINTVEQIKIVYFSGIPNGNHNTANEKLAHNKPIARRRTLKHEKLIYYKYKLLITSHYTR